MADEAQATDTPDAADGLIRLLDRTLGLLLALTVLFMMGLTFIDVSGRTLFNAPVPGGYEITQIAMGLVCYLGLAVVCMRREHITIGIFDHFFRRSVKRFQQGTINVVLGATTLVWAREIWLQADNLVESGEVLMFLRLSVAPVLYLMSVLTIAAAATLFILAWLIVRGATKPSSGMGIQ